ncbi:MAG: FAD-dependent oxidoreductase [Planctomycetes bacterium]|nr:FAD-dependent oxidoreductase [Planctomycetota bacterium]
MMAYDVIIVGGSAAGITAGITCRRHYPGKSVLLIRAAKQVPIPCGIPYIYGTVGSPEKNLIPDAVLEKNGIEFLVDEVEDIDREARVVRTRSGKTAEYDKLVLATGSQPVVPPIPGVDRENVYTIRKDVPYLAQLKERMDVSKNLVIVGGGFIGVEFADECRKGRDISVTIVEMLPMCLAIAFDEGACSTVEEILTGSGVKVLTGTKVSSFEGADGKVEKVMLAGGQEIPADLVILAIGAGPNAALAKKAGLELGPHKAIQVDRHMRTSDENIFACGDCVETLSFFTGKSTALKLASISTMQARIAGANLFGNRRENPGAIGVYSTVVNGKCFATAGLTEGAAREMGYEVVTGEAGGPNRHPGGMPGAQDLTVRLICEKPSGRLLGGQVYGAESGGELINAVGACISTRLTADALALFQLGTHPALTASPIAYQLVNAAEQAVKQLHA